LHKEILMADVITSLCLRDNGCSDVCPVECITPGFAVESWPTYYIDTKTCIDCGACIPECPYSAIFPEAEVPVAFRARGGELINRPDLKGHDEGVGHDGEAIVLETTRVLAGGEILDLTDSIRLSHEFQS
jgi:ferredoxin